MKYLRVPLFFIFILGIVVYALKMPIIGNIDTNIDTIRFDEKLLKQHVRILSENYAPRTCERPDLLIRSAEYINGYFSKWNENTHYQTYNVGKDSFSNIISIFGPETEQLIVVGAHYDAFSVFPGADDNASGVAGLLELSRALSNASLKNQVALVAYACEEPPYFAGPGMGSFVHAKSIAEKEIILMMSLEMIGYYSDLPNSQKYPIPFLSFLYPKTGNFVAVVGKLFRPEAKALKATIASSTDLDVYSINAPASLPGMDYSDHRNYWAQGYPAVMVTNTAFYRNNNYHTSSDTFETLDYKRMSKVLSGVHSHLLKLSSKTTIQ